MRDPVTAFDTISGEAILLVNAVNHTSTWGAGVESIRALRYTPVITESGDIDLRIAIEAETEEA
jgi:hypothetical protein